MVDFCYEWLPWRNDADKGNFLFNCCVFYVGKKSLDFLFYDFEQLNAVSAFAQTLRRYTSLNHLAQAARAVLQNNSQINQMLADLNRVDFHNVQEQVISISFVLNREINMKDDIQRMNICRHPGFASATMQ